MTQVLSVVVEGDHSRVDPDSDELDRIEARPHQHAPTFTVANRVKRILWQALWLVAARWTPPPLHAWRRFLLNACGAEVDSTAHVYASVNVWAPWNLTILAFGSLAPRVRVYNIAPVTVGRKAVVSQGAYLCTGTHDYNDPTFQLIAKPISIGTRAWVGANAFVGPGVNLEDGAILAAAAVAFRTLQAWTIYMGNPAAPVKQRVQLPD